MNQDHPGSRVPPPQNQPQAPIGGQVPPPMQQQMPPQQQGFQQPMPPQQGFQQPHAMGGQPSMLQLYTPVGPSSNTGLWVLVIVAVVFSFGILAAVVTAVGVATVAVVGENKAKLDSQALSSFADRLVLYSADSGRRRAMLECETQGSFKDLMMEFHEQRLISTEDLKRLSGASGMALGNPSDYRKGSSAWESSADACIFTGPNNPRELRMLLNWEPEEGEEKVAISFTYNQKYMEEALAEADTQFPPRIPVVFAGEIRAERLTLAQIEERCLLIDGKRVNLQGLPVSSLYGNYPFQYVSPK